MHANGQPIAGQKLSASCIMHLACKSLREEHLAMDVALRLVAGPLGRAPVVKGDEAVVYALGTLLACKVNTPLHQQGVHSTDASKGRRPAGCCHLLHTNQYKHPPGERGLQHISAVGLLMQQQGRDSPGK